MKLAQFIQPIEEEMTPFSYVPGHFFFCRTLELPDELDEAEERESYIELSLESLSPFPLEQLSWGYVADEESRSVFVYAACLPRIPEVIKEPWEEATYVFPIFLPFLLLKQDSPVLLPVVGPLSVSLLYFDGKHRFPIKLISVPRSEESEDGTGVDLDTLVGRLQSRIGAPIETKLLESHSVYKTTGEGAEIKFHQGPDSEDTEVIQFEGDEAIWEADVREFDFITSEKKRRKASKQIGWVLASAAIAAGIVLLLFFLNFVGGLLVSSRQAKVVEQDPKVFGIQQNSDFLVQLEQFSDVPFQPFSILAQANAVLLERQPRRIEFTSVSLNNKNELQIQGRADNVAEVNSYSDRLRANESFSAVDLQDIRTRGDKVNFSLNMRFNPGTLPVEEAELEVESEPETVASAETQPETEESETEEPDAAN